MPADLDLLLIAVFCTADDLLPRPARNARRILTDAEVVTLSVAQAIMGARLLDPAGSLSTRRPPSWPPRFATRRTPQALRCRWLGQPVRRRRGRRVARVPGQLALQLRDLRLELHDPTMKLRDHRGLLDHQPGELLIRRPPQRHIIFANQPALLHLNSHTCASIHALFTVLVKICLAM